MGNPVQKMGLSESILQNKICKNESHFVGCNLAHSSSYKYPRTSQAALHFKLKTQCLLYNFNENCTQKNKLFCAEIYQYKFRCMMIVTTVLLTLICTFVWIWSR